MKVGHRCLVQAALCICVLHVVVFKLDHLSSTHNVALLCYPASIARSITSGCKASTTCIILEQAAWWSDLTQFQEHPAWGAGVQ